MRQTSGLFVTVLGIYQVRLVMAVMVMVIIKVNLLSPRVTATTTEEQVI